MPDHLADNTPVRLTPEEARAVMKAIEDVEREEAAEQERKGATPATPPDTRRP